MKKFTFSKPADWKLVTLLKMSLFIVIFQGFRLQGSEHLFFGIRFSDCFRINVIAYAKSITKIL